MTVKIRLGTRGSPLALWQAHHVKERLLQQPGMTVDIVEVQTSGDVIRDVPLAEMGGQGVFTKEIQRAVLDGTVDVAVHSLKDLPTFAVENLVLAAVPKRGPTGDALVSKKHASWQDLPQGATVATSSLRRRAQALYRRPDLCIVDMRGNVETRLQKLEREDLDAVLLAEAGLRRLGLADVITEVLDTAWMLPAVGQGALGLECRADDATTRAVLEQINDEETRWCVLAERALLRRLQGGCHVPIGTTTHIQESELHIRGVVVSPDGRRRLEETLCGSVTDAELLGVTLAEKLLGRGAKELLAGE